MVYNESTHKRWALNDTSKHINLEKLIKYINDTYTLLLDKVVTINTKREDPEPKE